MDEIQRADPGAKRKAVWIVGITVLLGAATIWVFEFYQGEIVAWFADNLDYLAQNTLVVFLMAAVFAAPLIATAIIMFLLGRRIVKAQRFPPPDYPVYRDTRVLKGSRAIRRGRIAQLLSLVILLAAGVIPFLFRLIMLAFGEVA
ncbi:MAG: hypothetical protein ACN4GR_01465 [Arenicellales bacterium]